MREPTTSLLVFERTLARALPLSAAGRARREAMRTDLLRAVGRRRRRRRAARIAFAAVALLVAASLALRGLGRQRRDPVPRLALAHADFATVRDDGTRIAAARVPARAAAGVVRRGRAPLRHLEFTAAAAGPSDLAAWRVRDRAVPAAVPVGDEEVLALLAGANRPTGLVRAGSRVYFTADVFDPLGRDGP
jgi:hypothetical protein